MNIAAQRPNKKRHPCTVRRGRAVWRQAERRPGSRAKGERRQSTRMRVRRPTGKERGESASGSVQKRRTLKERSGKVCDLRKPRSSPAGRQGCSSILSHVIVTEWPRRQGRLGGASPRGRDRGIKRGAGLPAGVQSGLKYFLHKTSFCQNLTVPSRTLLLGHCRIASRR